MVKHCNQSLGQIKAITLSTSEGVPLGRVYGGGTNDNNNINNNNINNNSPFSEDRESPSDSLLNEETLALLETVWAPASKQFPVLGLDKVQCVTAIYNHGILVHLYWPPLVVTILCDPDSNLAAVKTTAIPLLRDALTPLRITLIDSLQLQEDGDVKA